MRALKNVARILLFFASLPTHATLGYGLYQPQAYDPFYYQRMMLESGPAIVNTFIPGTYYPAVRPQMFSTLGEAMDYNTSVYSQWNGSYNIGPGFNSVKVVPVGAAAVYNSNYYDAANRTKAMIYGIAQ